ncbi:alpha-amylase family glycosyl hydrolase [Kaistella antarctica]|uniref:Alpha-amlyase n=1 Tax=Kaistella antarctica TaxID=266748 RepID=A0A3S4YPG6_9FLAO|nr:alpha-amylase family glycosyl hydrolase [Kaistella antarctica]KEY20046.1 alpha-amlyase [Kaistella antarctica]SEV94387.1 alpha-amylase [Kaistella antarctica]VEH95574.1 Alpha-amylase precursor [Kaistella antarctica]
MKKILLLVGFSLLTSCVAVKNTQEKPFIWEGANVYFLLTDRFKNGDPANDINFNRTEKAAVLRGFEGGDLRGVIQKIDDNYFSNLGINAIWMTPVVEQIHGATNEGTGNTYGFHGYWTKDWTALDPNFGTKNDLKELVEKAHKKGIRIVLDAVINHTGPVTEMDAVYPNSWVRTSPTCNYQNYQNTTACTLVANLPDILTESNEAAELPQMLVDKWKKEGKYEVEMKSLEAFFARTGYPRAPKYYIMKWLADYVQEYGIDGYRVDTVKHTNEDVWKDFQKICQESFDIYKRNNPTIVLDNNLFFTVGEVYGYGISQKQNYDFGDRKVNYYQNGFKSLINFDFKGDANKSYEELFSQYSNQLNSDLNGKTVMNYLTSHDDGSPFDKDRERTYEAGTKLLLSPGISQVYYGDETARTLTVSGAEGDANLRSNMNWSEVENNPITLQLLTHYQKLGKFRANHPAVGAGVHQMISNKPYYFSRILTKGNFTDKVIIGLDIKEKLKEVNVAGVFAEGDQVRDFYSAATMPVIKGKVSFSSNSNIVLLEKIN